MTLPIAGRWFERKRIDDDITLLWEPHVIELMRCNIWHVRGAARDLIVDTGMGVSSLLTELNDLVGRPVTAVATHGHDDHIGSHHEFDDVVAHPAEIDHLEAPTLQTLELAEAWGDAFVADLRRDGLIADHPLFVDALPTGVTLESFGQRPVARVRAIEEGDVIDLGDRQFEVLHLPGHSPGSIGLWEARTGVLFSGDAVYDGTLLDDLPGSDVDQYCTTMHRLLELPVTVVHGGHDPSFGRDRLREIARRYLDQRGG